MSWSNIQNAFHGVQTDTGSSVSASFAGAVTTGSVVSGVVMWENDFPGPSLSNVTDDKGNTYTINVDALNDVGNGEGFSSFYATSFPNGLPTTITANFGASSAFFAIVIKEDSFGAGFTITLDGHNAALQTSTPTTTGANLYNSGSATTTANGNLINGFSINSGGNPTFIAGTSPNAFTQRALQASNALDNLSDIFSEDFVQTTAGSIAATLGNSSLSAGSVTVGAFMLAFKAVASGDTFANNGTIFFI